MAQQTYDQDDLDKKGNVPTHDKGVADNSFKGVSQTPPVVETDETGTPHQKGAPSGVWKEGDKVEDDAKGATPNERGSTPS